MQKQREHLSAAKQAHQRGLLAQQLGDTLTAENAYREALSLEPEELRSLNNLAVLQMENGAFMAAEVLLRRPLVVVERDGLWHDTAAPLLLNSLCQLRLRQHQPGQALAIARQLVQLAPTSNSWSNLAMAFRSGSSTAKAPTKALKAQQQALMPAVGDPLELLWQHQDSAVGSARQHLLLQNMAVLELALDPWSQRGWRMLEARLASNRQHWELDGPRPWQHLWRGEPVDELVIWDEQGFGDALQCLRWLPMAFQRCGHLTLLVRPELQRLAQRWLEPVESSQGRKISIQAFQESTASPWALAQPHCPLMSLPVALGLEGQAGMAIEPIGQYRRASTGAEQKGARSRQRIGVVWSAGKKQQRDAQCHSERRSLPTAELEHLIHDLWGSAIHSGDVEFLNLQMGDRLPERSWLAPLFGNPPGLEDWAATSAFVAELDCVFTVDTAMVHLAGSLGVPSKLILNNPCDWRWGATGSKTPWYPSVEVIRHQWKPFSESA